MNACKEMIRICDQSKYADLAALWERSVSASHDFLVEADIQSIRQKLASDYFPMVDLYGIYRKLRCLGFIGVRDRSVEMLFIDAPYFNQGLGNKLMNYALARHKVKKVEVNAQNPKAVEFYQKFGFQIVSRRAKDSQGRNYPILTMELRG